MSGKLVLVGIFPLRTLHSILSIFRLLVLPALLPVISPINSLKRVIAFAGKQIRSLTCPLLSDQYSSSTREAKINTLREAVKFPGLEFTTIDDVAKSDVTEALKGLLVTIKGRLGLSSLS